MQQEHQRQKQNPWIVTGAAVLAVIVVGVLIVILTPRQKKVEAPPTVSAQEWQAWAMGVEGKAYDALTTQGVKLTQNSESGDTKLPSMSLVDGKPSFGVAAADTAYLRNAGALTGKIALFQENIAYGTPYMPYDSKTQFPLHDEVVDRTPYLDDQHQVAMPFSASRYAQTPQDCDTLVIMRSFMVAGAKADVDEYSMYVDTEVIIINARTDRLQHLEYLGKCLADKNAQNPSFWMMRGEALQYLASLSLDGIPSKIPYTTPYESESSGSGGSAPVSDADWHGGYVLELWTATGQFGSYNTLVLADWERNPAPVSQQKMRDFALRLYDIQGGKIIKSKNYQDVVIENFNPHTLVVKFAGGKGVLTGNVEIKTFPGTLTLPGMAPVNFTAEQAGGQACPDCKDTGKINGKPCSRCGGIGALVMYKGLLL